MPEWVKVVIDDPTNRARWLLTDGELEQSKENMVRAPVRVEGECASGAAAPPRLLSATAVGWLWADKKKAENAIKQQKRSPHVVWYSDKDVLGLASERPGNLLFVLATWIVKMVLRNQKVDTAPDEVTTCLHGAAVAALMNGKTFGTNFPADCRCVPDGADGFASVAAAVAAAAAVRGEAGTREAREAPQRVPAPAETSQTPCCAAPLSAAFWPAGRVSILIDEQDNRARWRVSDAAGEQIKKTVSLALFAANPASPGEPQSPDGRAGTRRVESAVSWLWADKAKAASLQRSEAVGVIADAAISACRLVGGDEDVETVRHALAVLLTRVELAARGFSEGDGRSAIESTVVEAAKVAVRNNATFGTDFPAVGPGVAAGSAGNQAQSNPTGSSSEASPNCIANSTPNESDLNADSEDFVKDKTYSIINMADLRMLWAKMQADPTLSITDGVIFRLEPTMLKELPQLKEFLKREKFLQCFGGTLLVGDQSTQRCFPVRAQTIVAGVRCHGSLDWLGPYGLLDWWQTGRPWTLMLPQAPNAEGALRVPSVECKIEQVKRDMNQIATSGCLDMAKTFLGAEGQPADVDFVNCTDDLGVAVFQSADEHHELYAERYRKNAWQEQDKADRANSQNNGEKDQATSRGLSNSPVGSQPLLGTAAMNFTEAARLQSAATGWKSHQHVYDPSPCPPQIGSAVKRVTEADHFVKDKTYSIINMADLRMLWAKMQADPTLFYHRWGDI
ncbi:hypothetical protein FACS1894198_6300 [Clostridia bacterium]|nr:hypothetical protein FACS1894198_6300 [Clostridia bacterium]